MPTDAESVKGASATASAGQKIQQLRDPARQGTAESLAAATSMKNGRAALLAWLLALLAIAGMLLAFGIGLFSAIAAGDSLAPLFGQLLIPFVTAVCMFVGMLYVTALIDVQLALVALSVSPLLLLIARSRRRRLRPLSREIKKLESSAMSVTQEALGALRVVKAFGQEDREHERFTQRSERGVQRRIQYSVTEGVFSLFVGGATAAGTAIVLLLGVSHVQASVLTLGDLLLVMTYLTRLYEPLQTIGRKTASLQNHLATAPIAKKSRGRPNARNGRLPCWISRPTCLRSPMPCP